MMIRVVVAVVVALAASMLPAEDPKFTPKMALKVKHGDLGVKAVRAFNDIRFRRPIDVRSAPDGGKRIFVAEQYGTIKVLSGPDAKKATVFLDLTKKVVYKDKQNEEGLLGMAFHPKFKTNGQFFLYYTTTAAPHTSVISRFQVSKENPNRAMRSSEQEIMRIKQPFWNHNGGTIEFGPDGMLYVGLGDGGSANDPKGNGQNLGTLLGSILRIDVDRKDAGKQYAIPKDNPFVGKKGARGEIYAYGLRNVWRMGFDSKTGLFWAADVGQNLWEEICIIEKGGNYGWNRRESMHPFAKSKNPAKKSPEFIDPIWEYHHNIGKSITGGFVYRGKAVPALVGKYLYADYVKGWIRALDYDAKSKKVIGDYAIDGPMLPVMSWGYDADGEAYFTTPFGIIYKLVAKK